MNAEKLLHGSVVPIATLKRSTMDEMYALMAGYFAVQPEHFTKDLQQKDFVILLQDQQQAVQGFTSLKLFQSHLDGQEVRALYSGDTIIHQPYRATLELPRVWIPFMLDLAQKAGDVPFYWFLISSGFRTYRYLPVFFREFFPRYNRPTPPDIQKLLHHFGEILFGDAYDPETGTIELEHPTPLHPGVEEEQERTQDPHVAFFRQANPEAAQGKELACITRLSRANFRSALLRRLGI